MSYLHLGYCDYFPLRYLKDIECHVLSSDYPLGLKDIECHVLSSDYPLGH